MERIARNEESRCFTLCSTLRSLISFEMTALFRCFHVEILHFALRLVLDDSAFSLLSLSFRMKRIARNAESRCFTLYSTQRSLISFEMTALFRCFHVELLHFALRLVLDDSAFSLLPLSFRMKRIARNEESRCFTLYSTQRSLISFEMTALFRCFHCHSEWSA